MMSSVSASRIRSPVVGPYFFGVGLAGDAGHQRLPPVFDRAPFFAALDPLFAAVDPLVLDPFAAVLDPFAAVLDPSLAAPGPFLAAPPSLFALACRSSAPMTSWRKP